MLKNTKEIIAANIRWHREIRLGWTQDKASEKTEVPKRTYQRAEDPEENSDILTLAAIAKGFGVQLWELLIERGSMPEATTFKPTPSEALAVLSEVIKGDKKKNELETETADFSDQEREMLADAIEAIRKQRKSISTTPARELKRKT